MCDDPTAQMANFCVKKLCKIRLVYKSTNHQRWDDDVDIAIMHEELDTLIAHKDDLEKSQTAKSAKSELYAACLRVTFEPSLYLTLKSQTAKSAKKRIVRRMSACDF